MTIFNHFSKIVVLVLVSFVCGVQAMDSFNYKVASTLNPLTNRKDYSQEDLYNSANQISSFLKIKEDWRRDLLHPEAVVRIKGLIANPKFTCKDMDKTQTNIALQKILDTNSCNLVWSALPIYLTIVAVTGAVVGGSVLLAKFIQKKRHSKIARVA